MEDGEGRGVTIEIVERRALDQDTPYLCALVYARGCRLNLNMMDFDKADEAFGSLLQRGGKSAEFQDEAREYFPGTWKSAWKPLPEVDPVEYGVSLSRRLNLEALAFPECCFDDRRKRFWIVLCYLAEYTAQDEKPVFSCTCANYEEKSGGDLRRIEVNRLLHRLSNGKAAPLEMISEGTKREKGRPGKAALFWMTPRGWKFMPPRELLAPPPVRPLDEEARTIDAARKAAHVT